MQSGKFILKNNQIQIAEIKAKTCAIELIEDINCNTNCIINNAINFTKLNTYNVINLVIQVMNENTYKYKNTSVTENTKNIKI